MEHLLLLVHRMPYPPNKGDKIRSYHLLRHLAQRYRVHLGTFIDDPADWQHVDTVKQWCEDSYFANMHPRTARIKSLTALATNRALTVDYYRDAGLKAWVDRLMRAGTVKKLVVFSSGMAQYATDYPDALRVIDFVDIDSDKWRQYADGKSWPMRWLYQRESRTLLDYERQVARDFDASLFVSPAEAALFKSMAPESADKTDFFSNGVDTDYFSPARSYPNPYSSTDKAIVFTGAMDYWPNVDAVEWFARDVMPRVMASDAAAVFYIVGTRPSAKVQALASLPGVRVTGSVPDVRPYLAHARVAVAPLRIARGIQNKVLEAMAMARPTVVSPQALEGIDAQPESDLLLADEADKFADAVSRALGDTSAGNMIGQHARATVEARYGWSSSLARVDALLDTAPQRANATPYSVEGALQ